MEPRKLERKTVRGISAQWLQGEHLEEVTDIIMREMDDIMRDSEDMSPIDLEDGLLMVITDNGNVPLETAENIADEVIDQMNLY